MIEKADYDLDTVVSEEEFYNLLTKKVFWFWALVQDDLFRFFYLFYSNFNILNSGNEAHINEWLDWKLIKIKFVRLIIKFSKYLKSIKSNRKSRCWNTSTNSSSPLSGFQSSHTSKDQIITYLCFSSYLPSGITTILTKDKDSGTSSPFRPSLISSGLFIGLQFGADMKTEKRVWEISLFSWAFWFWF